MRRLTRRKRVIATAMMVLALKCLSDLTTLDGTRYPSTLHELANHSVNTVNVYANLEYARYEIPRPPAPIFSTTVAGPRSLLCRRMRAHRTDAGDAKFSRDLFPQIIVSQSPRNLLPCGSQAIAIPRNVGRNSVEESGNRRPE